MSSNLYAIDFMLSVDDIDKLTSIFA